MLSKAVTYANINSARVRKYQKSLPLKEAVERAVKECIEEEILRKEEYDAGKVDGIEIGEARERKNTEKERRRAELAEQEILRLKEELALLKRK